MTHITRFAVAQIAHTYSPAFVLSDGSWLMSKCSGDLSEALTIIDHWKRVIADGDIRTDLAKWGRDELEMYTAIPTDKTHLVEAPQAAVAAAQKARAAKLAENMLFDSKASYMYASWGYDQTNVTWYEIVKVTPKSVQLVEVASRQMPTNLADGQAGGLSLPIPGAHRGKPFTRKRQGADGFVRVTPYQYAHSWDGRPRTYTCGG